MTDRVRYLDLAEVLTIAGAVLAVEPRALVPRSALLDSALNAPRAGFGDHDQYPSVHDKAAALVWHVARNHALPDGNKRTAWVAGRLFLALNGWTWTGSETRREETVRMVEGVAAGSWPVERLAQWIETAFVPVTP